MGTRHTPVSQEVRDARRQASLQHTFNTQEGKARLYRLARNPEFVTWLEESFQAYQANRTAQRKSKAVA